MAAQECAEVLDKPALKSSWEKIQAVAKENAVIYESVFNFIPRDDYETDKYESSNQRKRSQDQDVKVRPSLWPTMAVNTLNIVSAKDNMPFSDVFWEKYNNRSYNLNNIKGFFTALPAHWTENENNLIPFNMRLIANNNLHTNDATQLASSHNKNDLRNS